MAEFKVEYNYKHGMTEKTLTFMDKDYTEHWEDNSNCYDCIENQIDEVYSLDALAEEYPDNEKGVEELRNISSCAYDDDEIWDALAAITDLEEEMRDNQ